MHLLPLDFETYWAKDHSLSCKHLTPITYVMHPETEIISCSAAVDDGDPVTVFGEDEVRRLLVDMGVEKALAIAHNMSMFDSMILAWRLKLNPRMWGCTLAMGRPKYGRTPVGLSLDKLDRALGGTGKVGHDILVQTKGRHLKDFTPAEVEAMRTYNGHDVLRCRHIFKQLRPITSNREMWAIDSNIRMLVEDQFVLNVPMLTTALERERARKHKTLMKLAAKLGFDTTDESDVAQAVKDELMSAPKFKRLLETMGVEVPMKPSPKDETKEIPALAKTDPEFTALLEHEDELVSAAAAARLEMKSTLLESRLEAFIETAAVRGGKLPIPSKYSGAHTYRDSGELYNALNMPRIDWDINDKIVPKLTNSLRLSLCAPPGKTIFVADLSGIEMRINHTLWKVKYSTDLWKSNPKADIYKPTAAGYYGIDVLTVDKQQRQFGKVLQLACGFQCGGESFQAFARKFDIVLDLATAQEGVYGWRNLTPEIADRSTGGWAKCQSALDYILAGQETTIDPWGLTHTCREGIVLPDGNLIRYPKLRKVVDERDGRAAYKYGEGRHTRFIYGGKVDENIVQALGRIILMDNIMEFWRRTGMRPPLRVYDEAAYIEALDKAPGLLEELLKIMRTPPKWWPDLVVWSEGDMATSYGLAK